MISAFHVSYKTASKASLIEKAAKEGRERAETEGTLTHGNKQISNCYIY